MRSCDAQLQNLSNLRHTDGKLSLIANGLQYQQYINKENGYLHELNPFEF